MSASIILDTGLPVIVSEWLRAAFGPAAAKQAAGWADVSHRTVEDWLQGRFRMSAVSLLRLCRHSGFRAFVRTYLDRIEQQEADFAIEIAVMSAKRSGSVADSCLARFERRRARAAAGGKVLPREGASPHRLRRAG